MKKIFLGMLFIAFTSTVFANNDGGKKKNRKKATTECKADKSCNPHCPQKPGKPGCCDKPCSKNNREKSDVSKG